MFMPRCTTVVAFLLVRVSNNQALYLLASCINTGKTHTPETPTFVATHKQSHVSRRCDSMEQLFDTDVLA
jgi:predicted Abi (CAAX) family protease